MAYDASDNLNAVSAGIGGLAALGSAYAQSEALKSQGSFQLAMARINAQFAEIQAKQVLDQGNEQANQIRKKGNKIVGSQRAAAAAQGIDVNDTQGSAADQIDDTKLAEAQDMATTKNNAWMTAWGIRTQSTLNINDAEGKKAGADFAANQTLLTGGLNALSAATKVGAIYAKSSVKTKTETKNDSIPSYPSGLTGGELYDRSVYGSPKPGGQYGGWWQSPSEDEK